MSLHAQVSPEAQAALASQRRNSTIAAIIIALLVCVLLGLLFWTFKIFLPDNNTKPIVAFAGDPDESEELVKPKVTTAVKKKPASPSSASAPVIVSSAKSPMAVPTPDIPFDAPSPEFGSNDGLSFGNGNGKGTSFGDGGKGFGMLPTLFKKRCTPSERLARVKEMGGNEKCDEAVIKALRWMQKTQNADGSSADKHIVGMTGFTVLAYLGHCETPLSPEFGESVEKAILFLVNNANANDGRLGDDFADNHWVYEHAIATYALAEAYTFCNLIKYEVPGLKEAVQQAGNVLISGQAGNGGWRYSFSYDKNHDDTSVTGFCMQALKALKHTGLTFNKFKSTANAGVKYLENSQNPDGQLGYAGKQRPKATMTGAGLLCLQQWGHGKSKTARKALKFLVNDVKFSYGAANLYGHYYYGQAFMEAGGDTWKNYNAMFRDEMLSGQKVDGSFKPSKLDVYTHGSAKMNAHYLTCMATLSLEVYYRFLPGTSKK